MHNPGDPGLGQNDIILKKRVLILKPLSGVLIDRSKFDAVVPLNGHDISDTDEAAILADTTL